MTRDEILAAARDAGALVFQSNFCNSSFDFTLENLERFAALVAAHEREKQAKQEPVTISCECGDIYERDSFGGRFIKLHGICPNCDAVPQAEQEPVAWARTSESGEVLDCISHTYKVTQPCTVDYDEPLYAAPVRTKDLTYSFENAAPVRTKDLTDDEIDAFIDRAWDKQMSMPEIIRAVIAADREKNK